MAERIFCDHESAFRDLITLLRRKHGSRWHPSIDTELLFQAIYEPVAFMTNTLTERINLMALELDALKTAVAANTSATQGAGALISQQRGTIDTQAARIADLEAQIAAGSGGGGTITGVDPAELVPLTKTLTDDDNALVDAMIPPAPSPAPAG